MDFEGRKLKVEKRYIILLIICMMSLIGVQAENIITGRVLDQSTRQPIDFANVTMIRTGETVPAAGGVTDADGLFLLNGMTNGKYTLVISFMGYTDLTREVSMSGKELNIGKIYLSEDTRNLQEVEVVGQNAAMRFELDKKVFSVDQNIANAGGSVSDALENIPTVEVDQEGNISLRNSEEVEIWINGKPAGLTAENRAQVLAQMPAESIKEIELITNPSAKYSPEGTAGIINLVLKKDRKAGYYGSVTAGIQYGLAAPWTVPPGANVGVNLNFNKGIVDAYINAGYRYNTSNGGVNTDRYNLTPGTMGQAKIEDIVEANRQSHLVQTGLSDRRGHGMFLRAGLDFRLGEHSTLGVSGFGMVSEPSAFVSNDISRNTYLLTSCQTGDTMRYYHRDQQNRGWHPGGNVRLDYQFKYQQHSLHLSGAYNHFTWNQESQYTQAEWGQDTLTQEQTNYNRDPSVEVKADYEWKPTQSSRLEAGYQATLAWRSTIASAYEGENRSQELYPYYNDFRNQEQNHALYITYGNRFFNRLSLQVGLRGEYFIRHIESDYKDAAGNIVASAPRDTSYFQLFPSAYISYDFGHGHELQLNYTRRVNRPRGHQINPRIDFSDSTNIRYGNPDLLPSYSNSLELNYLKSWERHTLSAGVFWRMQEGIVQNVRFIDVDVMKNTFINVANRQEVGVEMVGKNRLFGELLQLTTSVNFYYNAITAGTYNTTSRTGDAISVTLPKQDIFAWSARLNASFLFTKTFSGQISGNYRSPRVVAQGTTTHSYSIDLGLRKTFLDRRLALAFNVRDILNSRARRNTTWGDGFWQKQERRWNSRTVSLTLTYNFGTNNRKKPDMQGDTNANSYEDNGFEE